jgi:acetyl esterase/lipase
VIQTLLSISHRRSINQTAPNVSAAVTFSAWLDLTCSNPGYRTENYCTGLCLDQGSPNAGWCMPSVSLSLLLLDRRAHEHERAGLPCTISFAGMHDAGWDAAKGQCAAIPYAGDYPISHPLLSPFHAGPELLASFPPTLLIVGGTVS